MNRKEIEQAITELSPKELARFHKWFEGYFSKTSDEQHVQKQHIDKLKGSLKGKGLLKALKTDKELEKKF